MRLATKRDGSRDGALVLVDRSGTRCVSAQPVARTLQAALDEWGEAEPALRERAQQLEAGTLPSEPLDIHSLSAPLPRAYEWVDGSAFLNHVRLVRRARGAELPPTLTTDPLIYQGGSGVLLGPTDDLSLEDPEVGLDFESEVVVILNDVAQGTRAAEAESSVCLVLLANDVSLRNLIPPELAKGFGFFQSKPATAFSPFAVTPDELGAAWHDGRVHLPLLTRLNGKPVGKTEAGPEMHFSFFDLIEHMARTRAFTAGTLLGSGTVSNEDPAMGFSCLAEQRTREVLAGGRAVTPFMAVGDEVEIEMLDPTGRSLFGRIHQKVVGQKVVGEKVVAGRDG